MLFKIKIMYLAPLNYDRYFRKVFSDLGIAKRFLEDFFDTDIESIESLSLKHKVTDAAAGVEFDFRCKMGGQTVIIDMQQWWKRDIVKRFYLYHTLNTALQLETLPEKSIDLSDNKRKDIKDYDQIVPVITLIWMADDMMDYKEDFVSFTMTPEIVSDFIRDKTLWHDRNVIDLLEKREQLLSVLNNKTRQLDFLQKNKLIYAFQKNIVRNKKFKKYFRWFELAELSRDKDNTQEDFDKYMDDPALAEVIRRISKEFLRTEDYEYIEDYEKFTIQVKRFEKVIREEGIDIGIDIGIEKGIELGVEREKGRKKEEERDKVREAFRNGFTVPMISGIMKLGVGEVEEILREGGLI